MAYKNITKTVHKRNTMNEYKDAVVCFKKTIFKNNDSHNS